VADKPSEQGVDNCLGDDERRMATYLSFALVFLMYLRLWLVIQPLF
jgi:hypothetical protein